jgi:hypothetical protein
LSYRIDTDGEWLTKDRLVRGNSPKSAQTTFLRHDDVFAQAAFDLAGTTEKFELATGVFPPGKALVAPMTTDSRIDDDPITGLNGRYCRANLNDGGGAFMTDYERVFHDLRADPPGLVIVYVTATDTDHVYFQQYVGILFNHRTVNIDQLHPPNTR